MEHSAIYATCRYVLRTIADVLMRAVTVLPGTESTFLKFLKKKLQRRLQISLAAREQKRPTGVTGIFSCTGVGFLTRFSRARKNIAVHINV